MSGAIQKNEWKMAVFQEKFRDFQKTIAIAR